MLKILFAFSFSTFRALGRSPIQRPGITSFIVLEWRWWWLGTHNGRLLFYHTVEQYSEWGSALLIIRSQASIYNVSLPRACFMVWARQNRYEPPPEFPLASPYSGIVHHLSGPNIHALPQIHPKKFWSGRRCSPMTGISTFTFIMHSHCSSIIHERTFNHKGIMNRWEQSEFSLRKIKDRKDKMRTKIGRIKILHPLQKEKTCSF